MENTEVEQKPKNNDEQLFISAGFLTIVKNYDKALRNDDWFIIALSISWTTICFCNGYLEYKRSKNYR
jgi:hypothetical protein